MSNWKKVLVGAAAVLTLGVGANMVAFAGGGSSSPSRVDISGPCDETEHATDPRCTAVGRVDDNSGPGGGNDDREDNSGPSENSGPGSHEGRDDDDDRDDNSGRGHGDDDHNGDNSGPGGEDD
jgi:hypothetical protein